MFDAIAKLTRDIAELRRLLSLLRKVLIRQGTIDSVDTVTCTVVVVYPNQDVLGFPVKSNPMPWLQRSSEHRPPTAGDHALVIDPSLGAGAGLVIVGWPSTAKPSPELASSSHVLYSGTDPCKVKSPNVELGVSPTDFASLSSRVDAEFARIWELLSGTPHAPVPPNPLDPPQPSWVPVSSDGGAALAAAAALWKVAVASVAAAQVKIR